jgi:hypothetical protein
MNFQAPNRRAAEHQQQHQADDQARLATLGGSLALDAVFHLIRISRHEKTFLRAFQSSEEQVQRACHEGSVRRITKHGAPAPVFWRCGLMTYA